MPWVGEPSNCSDISYPYAINELFHDAYSGDSVLCWNAEQPVAMA